MGINRIFQIKRYKDGQLEWARKKLCIGKGNLHKQNDESVIPTEQIILPLKKGFRESDALSPSMDLNHFGQDNTTEL